MTKEYKSHQFDEIYGSGGAEGIYDLPYQHSGYRPLFEKVREILVQHTSRSVLEVGCGTGAFAHLLRDRAPHVRYRGFDFSRIAVERAAKRLGSSESVFVGDARHETNYSGDFDSIVCTEVLEHIESDLEVITSWPSEKFCVCSVPNFDADNHVRVFRNEEDVIARYGNLIKIESIQRVKKPFLPNISSSNTLRHLWWNRYRPARALAIAGLASFETLGGWFVFSGHRNS